MCVYSIFYILLPPNHFTTFRSETIHIHILGHCTNLTYILDSNDIIFHHINCVIAKIVQYCNAITHGTMS